MENEKCCGTCHYRKRDYETNDWICTNIDSDCHGVPTAYGYRCFDYEKREK